MLSAFKCIAILKYGDDGQFTVIFRNIAWSELTPGSNKRPPLSGLMKDINAWSNLTPPPLA